MLISFPESFHDAVVREMATDILPALRNHIQDAAYRVATTLEKQPGAFTGDIAAQQLVYEVIEFLTQAEIADDPNNIVHPCQLTERHFFHYYGLPAPGENDPVLG